MTEPLSPAAQAVLDAYDNSHFDDDIGDRVAIAAQAVLDAAWQLSIINCKSIAAALRAVADQVVPEEQEPVPDEDSVLEMQIWAGVSQRRRTRSQLLAIATELEGING